MSRPSSATKRGAAVADKGGFGSGSNRFGIGEEANGTSQQAPSSPGMAALPPSTKPLRASRPQPQPSSSRPQTSQIKGKATAPKWPEVSTMIRPQTSSKQDANDRRLAGLPSIEVANLQAQVAKLTQERDEAVTERDLAKKALKESEAIASTQLEDLEQARQAAEVHTQEIEQMGVLQQEINSLSAQALTKAEEHQLELKAQTAGFEKCTKDWALTKNTLDLKLREITLRGDGSASESQELKSELETLKSTLGDKSLDIASKHAKILTLERELSAAVQGSESGAAEREKQLTQSLAQQKTTEDELLMARQELKSIRMSVRVKVEEEAEERWRGVLKGEQQLAKKNADAAAQKLEELTAELGKKLNDSQTEAGKWKTQAADFQSTAADKLAESSLLKREIEDLKKNQKQQPVAGELSHGELTRRIESLKEVVTHTLQEKAELEEEVKALQTRMAAQQTRGGVIQDLQDRLKMVKDMNSRLDTDNDELKRRLQTAQTTLRDNHNKPSAARAGWAPKTAGARVGGSTLGGSKQVLGKHSPAAEHVKKQMGHTQTLSAGTKARFPLAMSHQSGSAGQSLRKSAVRTARMSQ